MRRLLPIILLFIIFFVSPLSTLKRTYAAPVTIGGSGSSPLPTPDVGYSEDSEVNFVGKTAARSVAFLNWTLQNYHWVCIKLKPDNSCDNADNPLINFWITIRNIVYAFFAILVLVTSFVLISTRGKSLTIQRFLPRFVAVILLVTFSYSLIQFIYITTDIVQGFFLTIPTQTVNGSTQKKLISAEDLLYVGWDYENFRGLRKVHPFFDESVFINLLLARITSVTYYAMTGILIIRKIILWFFIILSPVFPILILYYPVRNTAKIWIGEFFRWLLYAPLFTVFLSGLVTMWQRKIPLLFNFSGVGTKFVYPTATNILLGGPGQVVTENNNLNLPDTFALYVVSLIMLWVVTLLPFVLLQIFLDYLNNFSFSDNPAFQKIINSSFALLNRNPQATPLPPGPSNTGNALSLPFAKFSYPSSSPVIETGEAKQLPLAQPIGNVRQFTNLPYLQMQNSLNYELLQSANLSVPTIKDIAVYEKATLINRSASTAERTVQSLKQVANPTVILNPLERDKFVKIKETLVRQSRSGNPVAQAILSAANIANSISNVTTQAQNLAFKKSLTTISQPEKLATKENKEQITALHDTLVKESQQGNTLASTVLSVKESTSLKELQNIREQLFRESVQGNTTATSVLATSFTKGNDSVLREVLSQAANPQSITNSQDKEKITQLHESLLKESKEGNQLATTILSSSNKTEIKDIEKIREKLVQATLQGNQSASTILSKTINQIDARRTQNILEHIANPATVTNTAEREKFTTIKEKLTTAQQQGNQIATTILTTIKNIAETKNINSQSVLEQLANPNIVEKSSFISERVSKLHEQLVNQSQKGDQFASSILAVNQTTSKQDIEKIQEKIQEEKDRGNPIAIEAAELLYKPANTEEMHNVKERLIEAKEKGEPLAGEILSFFSTETPTVFKTDLPQTNRIQTVSLEDYESVRQMWQENYNSMDVPEGLSNRKQWVSDDVNQIDTIIGLLTSGDQDKIQEGMQEVGTILPFLMLGGFSQEEIVAYLQAKKEAGKSVLEVLEKEETEDESKVNIEKRSTTKSATMTQTVAISSEDTGESNIDNIANMQVSAPKVQINTQLLEMTHLPLPTMKDVVRFEIGLAGKNTVNKEEVTKVKEMLQVLANPMNLSSDTEKQKIEGVRTQLLENSQQGDQLATSIINAINHIAKTSNGTPIQQSTKINSLIFEELANPSTITEITERERIREMHDKLITAQTQGNQFASSFLSTVNTIIQTNTAHKKQVFEQIANPSLVTTASDKERYTQVHEMLTKESQQGNQLATTILSVSPATSEQEFEQLKQNIQTEKTKGNESATIIASLLQTSLDERQLDEMRQKISEEKAKGEPLAGEIETLLFTRSGGVTPMKNQTILPKENRVQPVNLEDYESVRQMWEENYKTVDVPTEMHDRAAWIKSDISNIDQMITLLSSNEEEQVEAGMQQVGNILPFLLLGGFSQDEIVAYLKAKKEAGKSVLGSLQTGQNEEEFVVKQETKSSNSQVMSASLPSENAGEESQSRIVESFDKTENAVKPVEINAQLVQVNGLTIPTIRDIANLERAKNMSQPNSYEEKVRDTLRFLANPEKTSPQEQEKLKEFQVALQAQRDQGNKQADVLLKAADVMKKMQKSGDELAQFHKYLLSLAHPDEFPPTEHIEMIQTIHADLEKQNEQQNSLAIQILNVTAETPEDQIKKLLDDIRNESDAGNQLAEKIWENAPKEVRALYANTEQAKVMLPAENTLQATSIEDYEEVRGLWEKFYKEFEAPDKNMSKYTWLQSEINLYKKMIQGLQSGDEHTKQEVFQSLAHVLPFIVLGGFTTEEIVSYLTAKYKAAESVLQSIPNEFVEINKPNTSTTDSTLKMRASST